MELITFTKICFGFAFFFEGLLIFLLIKYNRKKFIKNYFFRKFKYFLKTKKITSKEVEISEFGVLLLSTFSDANFKKISIRNRVIVISVFFIAITVSLIPLIIVYALTSFLVLIPVLTFCFTIGFNIFKARHDLKFLDKLFIWDSKRLFNNSYTLFKIKNISEKEILLNEKVSILEKISKIDKSTNEYDYLNIRVNSIEKLIADFDENYIIYIFLESCIKFKKKNNILHNIDEFLNCNNKEEVLSLMKKTNNNLLKESENK
ncbi:hypothetical protein [Mesoplasma photuris]|uniref:hypothetical protein n=1 Tax=Mesoplasma photuris TaxID=217731 RepID=UPI0004E0BDF1|nr:hypothetical protein [Mesoplasma photuris]